MAYYSWDAILAHVAACLSDASGTKVESKDLVLPPKPDLGDIAYGCFDIAKKNKKDPAQVAEELAAKIGKGDHTILAAKAFGPYVNVALKVGDFLNRVVQDVENNDQEFGTSNVGQGKQLMLEYAQPNTHKEIHVGHLRNLILGSSLAKILKLANWDVITASYHGDIGAHVIKCLWLLVREATSAIPQPKSKKAKKGEPENKPLAADAWTDYVIENLDEKMADEILKAMPKNYKTGNALGRYYSEAVKLLEENPDWLKQVSEVQRKLEAKSPGWIKIWQETRRWSIAEMSEIFQELGVAIKRQYFESEVLDEGQKIVDELLEKDIARKSQGAIIVDLEEQKLPPFLIRKSDGTTLYATRDMALARLKLREYPKLERSLLMVDNRQALYFKQLFATFDLMGFKTPHEFIGYEFLTLKSGAMSSRAGNVVTWQGFRDEVLNYATKETRKRHEDWPSGRIQHTSWALAMGGIKFGMLRLDSDKIFVFDLEKAMSFDGDTGPYVQYAATRLNSILKKAGWNSAEGLPQGDLTGLSEQAEKLLGLQLAIFPSMCEKAAKELRPMIIASWCLQTAQRITAFYHDVPVLDAPPAIKQARMRLIAAVGKVLGQGLDLLGIPLPDEM